MSRKEIIETTAVAVALCGSVVDWPARFVFKVLEETSQPAKRKGEADEHR